MSQLITNRPGFVAANPHLKPAHRTAQSALFATAHTLGLKSKTPDERANMIGGINEFLALNIDSRTQLTVREMEALTVAIEAGAFAEDWRLTGDVYAEFDRNGNIDLLAGEGQPRILCRVCRERAQFYPLCDENGEPMRGCGLCRECAPRAHFNEAPENEALVLENYVLRLVLEDEHLDACTRELEQLSFRHTEKMQEIYAEICAQRESLHAHMDFIAQR